MQYSSIVIKDKYNFIINLSFLNFKKLFKISIFLEIFTILLKLKNWKNLKISSDHICNIYLFSLISYHVWYVLTFRLRTDFYKSINYIHLRILKHLNPRFKNVSKYIDAMN